MVLSELKFDRILIVKPSSLGDIIHALPVLNGLRHRYPTARISWLVNRQYAPLLEKHPQLDEVIPFDRQKFNSVLGAAVMTFQLGGFAKAIRSRKFDLAIDLQGLFRSGLMTWISRAPVRLGFHPAREGAGIFYTHRIPFDSSRHAVERNYAVAKILGFENVPVEFKIPVHPESEQSVRQKLLAGGLPPTDPFVLVWPGSRWETKNYLPDRYAELIDRWQQETNVRVVLGGSPSERELCRRIAQSCRAQPIDLAGHTDLLEMVALVAKSALVVCNDSAPAHLAAALRQPLVAIYGPTDPNRTGPYGSKGKTLIADLPCAPCFFRKLNQCSHDHDCMNRITVDQILQAMKSSWDHRPSLSNPVSGGGRGS